MDRFYGINPEDNSGVLNFNGLNQSQMLSQNSSLLSLGQTSNNLMGMDYPPNSSAVYLASNMHAFNNSNNNIDLNNNSLATYNRNMRFYNQQNSSNGFNPKNCGQTKVMNANNINYSQNNLMNNALLNVPTNYGNIMTTADYQHHMEPSTVGSLSSGGICHYSFLNGGSSCNNRNRYMPYNHNRACAAAAAAGSVPSSMSGVNQQQNNASTSLANLTSYQQFVPIFYNGSNVTSVAGMPAMNSQIGAGFTPTSLYNLNKNSGLGNPVFEKPSILQNPLSCSESLLTITSSSGQSIAQGNSNSVENYFKASTANVNPVTACSTIATASSNDLSGTQYSTANNSVCSSNEASGNVTLQITNLDYSMDEASLRNFLNNQLKPITPVVSLVFEGTSFAKVTVPDLYFAKQVVSNLHRKKIGHKRMLVSYTRDSSLTEINTLRCQVAGLLKDVPYYTLPMYRFRELFQSRFKTSISVFDIYKMQDICNVNSDNNDEKFISLQPDLISTLECSPLIEGLQHSVPYCTIHFKREQHKGWADQDIEPLPNIFMTIAEIQQVIYPLLKKHRGEIPVASLVHCIEGELNIQIQPNDNGVNLEHLICCIQGIQIQVNNFGIKILGWTELNKEKEPQERNIYAKNSSADPLFQISKEVIELVKMSPKSTMKFSRFIPAYHNHFGKQCRVADYGYTKLIELFEALSSVVQILGDGENRQITLTHRTQIRRFTSDLLRVLRAHGNNSVLLSQLPTIYAQTQNRPFDVTDYGVCDVRDILDGLVNSNVVVLSNAQQGKDILISIPKRRQTITEMERTSIFAGEMVELFGNAVQYTIPFQKFVRSYHYHFSYQCRLSDYGFMKLADLMESIHGVVEMETKSDEDKKIYLSSKVALRVFSQQCEDLIGQTTGCSKTCMELEEALKLHKKKYGYQMQPQTLGVKSMIEAVELMPFIEWYEKDDKTWIICHNEDSKFRSDIYRGMKILMLSPSSSSKQGNKSKSPASLNDSTPPINSNSTKMPMNDFIQVFKEKYNETLTETNIKAMKQFIEFSTENDVKYVRLTGLSIFVIQIVRLLEQRNKMHLNEIKNFMEISLTSTFKFGFPNLIAILTAYQDVFSIIFGATQERCEISLKPNCELRVLSNCPQQSNGTSGKSVFNKQQKPTRANRAPLTERIPNQGPPAKTRCLSMESPLNSNVLNINNNNNNMNMTSNTNTFPTKQIITNQFPLTNKTSFPNTSNNRYHNQQPLMNSSFNNKYNAALGSSSSGNSSTNMHSLNSSIYSSNQSSLLNSSMSNISSGSNKENSFNNSMNMLNGSFNSSGNASYMSDNSFNNLTNLLSVPTLPPPSSTLLMPSLPAMQLPQTPANIFPAFPQPSATSKLWGRRNSLSNVNQFPEFYNQANALQQMQQMQQMLPPSSSQGSVASIPPSILSTNTSGPGLANNNDGSSEWLQQHFNNLPARDQNGGDLKATTDNNNNIITNAKPTDLYEIVNNLKMGPTYEPPKPDTPPSENVPFWIDPIWSNNKDTDSNNNSLANIRLPDMKLITPMQTLLSPYSLSKVENLKQQFNFGGQDRKIA